MRIGIDRNYSLLPLIGSYEEIGMDGSYCLASYDRYNPYDYTKDKTINETEISWGGLQEQCLEKNRANFPPQSTRLPPIRLQYPPIRDQPKTKRSFEAFSRKNYRERTAVVIRKYDSQGFTPEIIQMIRGIITETALYSGGLYTVYLFVEVKDIYRPIFWSETEYDAVLTEHIPAEFRSMTILWNEHLIRSWYPQGMKDATLFFSYHPPLQLLSLHAPHIDHFWQLELDVRYTGHWFELFENADAWTRQQPRKLLWERAEQHYMPWYHGSWADFSASVATLNPAGGVWGPVNDSFSSITIDPIGPTPPTQTPADDADSASWGVGEAADLITLSNIFNMTDKNWYEGQAKVISMASPRRVLFVQPVERVSRRLLRAAHEMHSQGATWITEGFYPTVALQHGLKAVHFPVPQFWGGMRGEVGVGAGERNDDDGGDVSVGVNADADAVKDEDAIANLTAGFTSASHAFHKINDWPGGIYDNFDEQALDGEKFSSHMPYWWTLDLEAQYGMRVFRRWYGRSRGERLCLPGMLFHPIKDVDGEVLRED